MGGENVVKRTIFHLITFPSGRGIIHSFIKTSKTCQHETVYCESLLFLGENSFP
jgi:hypothetical protein